VSDHVRVVLGVGVRAFVWHGDGWKDKAERITICADAGFANATIWLTLAGLEKLNAAVEEAKKQDAREG